MRIYTRVPRIKIGNTTYRFGKNGVSRSTKICKGIRIGTTASGKRYISGGKGIFRFYQDLDELNYDAKTGNLQNQNPFGASKQLSPTEKKQRQQQLQQLRNQRKNDLSFGLLLAHPFVFFDHLIRRDKTISSKHPLPNSNNKQPLPVPGIGHQPSQQQSSINVNTYETKVDIFKEVNGIISKVTGGNVSLDIDKIVIKANVTKEIFYTDISDVHIEKGKVLISSKGRNIPLIVEMKNPELFMMELCSRISNK